MEYRVFYTKDALQDLIRLPQAIAKRITDKITFFRKQEYPLSFAKKLKDADFGEYRFRIGDYRAIFDIDHKGNITIFMIMRIKHRKDIYRL